MDQFEMEFCIAVAASLTYRDIDQDRLRHLVAEVLARLKSPEFKNSMAMIGRLHAEQDYRVKLITSGRRAELHDRENSYSEIGDRIFGGGMTYAQACQEWAIARTQKVLEVMDFEAGTNVSPAEVEAGEDDRTPVRVAGRTFQTFICVSCQRQRPLNERFATGQCNACFHAF